MNSLKFSAIISILCLFGIHSIAQLRSAKIKVPADFSGWTKSGLRAKPGDMVVFTASGTVDLGMVTKNVSPTGSRNPFLGSYNLYSTPLHGSVITLNGQIPVSAKKMEEVETERQFRCAPEKLIDELRQHPDAAGNHFVASHSQEISFRINDTKIDDNSGSFDVNIYVYTPLIPAHGLFDLASKITKENGILPFCSATDWSDLAEYDSQILNPFDILYFDGYTEEIGHYYLFIKRLGKYDIDPAAAATIMQQNINAVFPLAAADQQFTDTPSRSHVLLGKRFFLLWDLPQTELTPEVEATQVGRFYFTFKAIGQHKLKGTAIHGVFKDQEGYLYTFQQGRGVKDEQLWLALGNRVIAVGMWTRLASNFADLPDIAKHKIDEE